MNKPDYIVIHHSYMPDLKDGKSFDRIKRYHININGWKDIGYHIIVEYNGNHVKLRRGRSFKDTGAHAIGFNTRSIGICVVGNYDSEPMQKDKKALLLLLIRRLMKRYKIDKSRVIGHRETYKLRGVELQKSCPGNKISMDKFREEI
jgi:N-acetyl-anhydromuramyl-L-alanine amidase AmpD